MSLQHLKQSTGASLNWRAPGRISKATMAKSRYDYGRDFNARKYLEQYYKTDDEGKNLENTVSGFIFRKMNSIFEGCDKGKGRLLDVGTGPSIAFLIPGSLKFHYIYCSDFTPGCRMELTMWCAGDSAAYRWDGFFKSHRYENLIDYWELLVYAENDDRLPELVFLLEWPLRRIFPRFLLQKKWSSGAFNSGFRSTFRLDLVCSSSGLNFSSPSQKHATSKANSGGMFCGVAVVLFQYAARLDQKESEWEDYEERLRNCIIGILPCDLMCSEPLTPEKLTPVDVMTACFSFSSAAGDYEDFENCLERMSEYLKTDGTLIFVDFLGASYYMVDDEKFHSCKLTEEDCIKALKYAGYRAFEISKASESSVSPDKNLTDAEDVIIIKATRNAPPPDVPDRPDTPPSQ